MKRIVSVLLTVVLILGVVAILILAASLWGSIRYNKILSLNETVTEKWRNLDSTLARRLDLALSLVNTVKGYAPGETDLFSRIASARQSYLRPNASLSEKIAAANDTSTLLSRLLLLQNSSPEIKANQAFLTLKSQLEITEKQIQLERREYNRAVRTLNASFDSFLGPYFARRARIKPAPLFEPPPAPPPAPALHP